VRTSEHARRCRNERGWCNVAAQLTMKLGSVAFARSQRTMETGCVRARRSRSTAARVARAHNAPPRRAAACCARSRDRRSHVTHSSFLFSHGKNCRVLQSDRRDLCDQDTALSTAVNAPCVGIRRPSSSHVLAAPHGSLRRWRVRVFLNPELCVAVDNVGHARTSGLAFPFARNTRQRYFAIQCCVGNLGVRQSRLAVGTSGRH
jgi:hypothetical protein